MEFVLCWPFIPELGALSENVAMHSIEENSFPFSWQLSIVNDFFVRVGRHLRKIIVMQTYIHIYVYLYVCIYSVCFCVCVIL